MDRMHGLSRELIDWHLDTAERSLNELKSAPQYVGGSSLQFFQSDSGASYDWTGTLPASPLAPATGTKILRVTATATTMANLFGDLIGYLYKGNMSTWYRPSNYLADLKVGTTPFSISVQEEVLDLSNRNKKQWTVVITGNKVTTCFVKLYVVANDEVTLTITEVN